MEGKERKGKERQAGDWLLERWRRTDDRGQSTQRLEKYGWERDRQTDRDILDSGWIDAALAPITSSRRRLFCLLAACLLALLSFAIVSPSTCIIAVLCTPHHVVDRGGALKTNGDEDYWLLTTTSTGGSAPRAGARELCFTEAPCHCSQGWLVCCCTISTLKLQHPALQLVAVEVENLEEWI